MIRNLFSNITNAIIIPPIMLCIAIICLNALISMYTFILPLWGRFAVCLRAFKKGRMLGPNIYLTEIYNEDDICLIVIPGVISFVGLCLSPACNKNI
jgi:hypothetical protein